MSSKNTIGKLEKDLDQLEEIVEQLESGDLSLDESIKKFEQGLLKYKSCRGMLKEAEKKITVLMDDLSEADYEE